VFATVLAAEFATYRSAVDPDGTFPAAATWTLPDLSAIPKLVCVEYCALATQLFRAYHPDDPADTISIRFLGWDKGAFGNHAQLLVTGVGLPILLDATSGAIAAVDLATLLAGTPVSADRIRTPSVRVESAASVESDLSFFRNAVLTAISTGLYPESVQLFNRDMDDYLRSLGWE
jgi:hypothetical protein